MPNNLSNVISISITGATGSGKSTIYNLIKSALENSGLNCTQDIKEELEHVFDPDSLDYKIERLKEKDTVVTLQTQSCRRRGTAA